MNNVNLIGRMVRDPELRYIPNSGQAVVNFTIAIDKPLTKEKKEEMEKQGKQTADFVDVVAWSKVAENVANFLKQGSLVGVSGRLQSGTYEDKEGRTIYTTDVSAFTVDFLDPVEK